MGAHGLVGERDQDERRRADHQQEDTDVEEKRAWQVNLADNGKAEVRDVRGEKRMREYPGPGACRYREQETDADQSNGPDVEPLFDPAGSAGHVLQDETYGEGQARYEPPARQIVAA